MVTYSVIVTPITPRVRLIEAETVINAGLAQNLLNQPLNIR